MKSNPASPSHHQELGDYLEILRCTQLVQGKKLTIKILCSSAHMSTRTYAKVKKESARI